MKNIIYAKCLKTAVWFSIGILSAALMALASGSQPPVTRIGETVPRTAKAFLNNPDNFQFVVVGDRTGGHRPGVFERAMDQINWLQPEFVMCVGDLIEGYTEDPRKLDQQWRAVESMIDRLEMPFFYTVGNHDMGNNVMRDLWRRRHGRDYYHFVYRGVLFISLNTEDPPVALSDKTLASQLALEDMMENDPIKTQQRLLAGSRDRPTPVKLPGEVAISDAQVEYVQQALADNRDVRWTLVFMHKPAWMYQSPQFARIEKLLGNRPYTVFAGHEHFYAYSRRHGRDYIDMGTTGGIWLRDGPGRLDHIAWVTMTDEGPIIANISLRGLTNKHGPLSLHSRSGLTTGEAKVSRSSAIAGEGVPQMSR